MARVIQVNQVHYPESDGKPMGETDDHRDEMFRHIKLLQHYFRRQKVYVSGDLLVYYEQGNPRKFVVPDTFVAKGVTPEKRRIYKIWAERKVPDVVIETTSRKTRRKDTEDKPALYARLGVKEYFLFDCLNEYLDPQLQGHHLVGSEYQSLAPDDRGGLVSQEMKLTLRPEGNQLQFYRLDTGDRLLTAGERARQATKRVRQVNQQIRQATEQARHAIQRAEREAEARRAAEEEVARLREELQRRR